MSDVLVFIACMIDGLVLLSLSIYLVSSNYIIPVGIHAVMYYTNMIAYMVLCVY